MKICCIGDIHGTTKFLECYNNILKNDNDCEHIIVFGDHFDPYDDIPLDAMVERYNEFIDTAKNDDRIISLLGNHDLAYYVLPDDITNRTMRCNAKKISDCIIPNLKDSYLCYKVGDWLFSHAGVSNTWYNDIMKDCREKILGNHKGWTPEDLEITTFYQWDYSGYGNNPRQGCTWIRPMALLDDGLDGYNQVVSHTRVNEIACVNLHKDKKLWLIDDCGKPNYLTLEI